MTSLAIVSETHRFNLRLGISLVKFAHFIYLYCMDYISVGEHNMLANSIILMTVCRVGTPCPRVVNNDTVQLYLI
jgi:hypothetical protein